MDFHGMTLGMSLNPGKQFYKDIDHVLAKFSMNRLLIQYAFREIERLSAGIQGVTFHSKSGPFVIKVSQDPGELRREYKIGRMLADLKSETSAFAYVFGIVPCESPEVNKDGSVVYCTTRGNVDYLVMENVLNSELFRRAIPRLSLLDMRKILLETVYSLGIANKHIGFIHNDLHSQNILIQRTIDGYRPVVIDYGLCTVNGDVMKRAMKHLYSHSDLPFRDIRLIAQDILWYGSYECKTWIRRFMRNLTGMNMEDEMDALQYHTSNLDRSVASKITYEDMFNLIGMDYHPPTRVDIKLNTAMPNLFVDYYNGTMKKQYWKIYDMDYYEMKKHLEKMKRSTRNRDTYKHISGLLQELETISNVARAKFNI